MCQCEKHSQIPFTVTQQVFTLINLTLDDMRVVLQEEVVQVFGDEGGHAGICQSCEEYHIRMKEIRKTEGRVTQ